MSQQLRCFGEFRLMQVKVAELQTTSKMPVSGDRLTPKSYRFQ